MELEWLHPSLRAACLEAVEMGCRIHRVDAWLDDRFALELPYCMTTIKFELLFDVERTEFPPDLIFGAGEDNFLEWSDLKTLTMWDHENPSMICDLVKEVVQHYKEFQKRQVANCDDSRLQFEVEFASSLPGVEFLYDNSGDELEVRFLLPFLIEGLEDQEHHDEIKLLIKYRVKSPSYSSTSLILPKNLSWVDDTKLPFWNSDTVLMDYFTTAKEDMARFVQLEKVRKVAMQRFFAGIVDALGRPLEVMEGYAGTKMGFAFDFGGFLVMTEVLIPKGFPREAISAHMNAVSRFSRVAIKPTNCRVMDVPGMGNMDPYEYAFKLKTYLGQVIPNFAGIAFRQDTTGSALGQDMLPRS